jgi:hypothetical protein
MPTTRHRRSIGGRPGGTPARADPPQSQTPARAIEAHEPAILDAQTEDTEMQSNPAGAAAADAAGTVAAAAGTAKSASGATAKRAVAKAAVAVGGVFAVSAVRGETQSSGGLTRAQQPGAAVSDAAGKAVVGAGVGPTVLRGATKTSCRTLLSARETEDNAGGRVSETPMSDGEDSSVLVEEKESEGPIGTSMRSADKTGPTASGSKRQRTTPCMMADRGRVPPHRQHADKAAETHLHGPGTP